MGIAGAVSWQLPVGPGLRFIVKKAGQEVWRWSYDRMFAQVLLDVAIEPGKTLSYQETWDQQDNAGNVEE